ncbi:hypothetical protein FOA52_002541 [Chlamydomonas sp. UWO 241]|nr:hypothetical protein FOA52_002541 [Chlamydomonas sp. UWO 241]
MWGGSGCMRPQGTQSSHMRCSASASSSQSAGADHQSESFSDGITGCAPCMDGTISVEIDEANVVTKFVAETLLPTRHGNFRLRGYKHSVDGGTTFTEPTAIVAGKVEGLENVHVRVHDACYTSEVLGSLKCDCAEQLALAMETIHANPPGMVIYLQQEGRGIGLANKIAAYALQEQGMDTVDANRALGFPDDCREYTSVRNILNDLGVKSIKLMTNNPRKINQLTSLGLKITGRVPCQVKPGQHNQNYLDTKRDRMDHLIEDSNMHGQWCYWNHDGEPRSGGARSVDRPEFGGKNGGMDIPGGVKTSPNGVDNFVAAALINVPRADGATSN